MMKRRDYYAFIADIYRFRPLAVIISSVLVTLPSIIEMATQGLSILDVLTRLVISILFMGALVWLVTGLLVRYARIQAQAEHQANSKSQTY